jgi:hypothetical protein
LIRSLRARGIAFAAIDLTVRIVNDKLCDEPLDEHELAQLLHYALLQPNRADFVVHPPRPVIVHRGQVWS